MSLVRTCRLESVQGTPRGDRDLQEEEAVQHAARVQTDTVRYGADTVRYLQRGGACLPAGPHERLVRGVDNQPTVFVLDRVIQRNLHLRFS